MKNKELVKKLQMLQDNIEVCVVVGEHLYPIQFISADDDSIYLTYNEYKCFPKDRFALALGIFGKKN